MKPIPRTFKFQMKNVANENGVDAEAKCTVPSFLTDGLLNKRMYCSSLYCNNTMLPCFIPDMCSEQYFDENIHGLQLGNCGFLVAEHDELTVDSIGYFVVVQKRDFTQTYISFLQHVEQDPFVTKPFFVTKDKNQWYSNKYYWYYNFTHFLKIVEQAYNSCFAHLFGPSTDPYVYFTSDGSICTMYVRQDVSDQVYMYQSESLYSLLPFNSSYFNFANCQHINDTEITTGFLNSTYDVFQCKFTDAICPFSEFLVECSDDMPLQFQQLTTSQTGEQIVLYNKMFLSFELSANNLYPYFEYSASSPVPYVDFTIDNVPKNKNFSIKCYARQKSEDVLIPIKLKKNERFNINFTVEDYN